VKDRENPPFDKEHLMDYAGFNRISRHDNLFQEQVHDPYKAKGKLHEPSVCSQCGAVYHEGRWQWRIPPANAHKVTCPACHRIHDHYPAGFLTMHGDFFQSHREEIMSMLRHHAQHERDEHPLERIMEVEEKPEETLITTTDIHLARGMGEALHHAYHGELEFHYNPGQYLLRVHWAH
jgi:NMD protein affecting ribosome stability and mRNA decay